MDLLLKNIRVDDPQSDFHGEEMNILVHDGRIEKISQTSPKTKGQVVDLKGISVSPGWLDIGVQAGEPGYEHREDFKTLAKSAVAGGFTGVACYPNTLPVMDSKSGISFLKENSKGLGIDFYAIGSISVGAKGENITELMDMHHSGAVAFSDGEHSIQHSGLMMRALLYVKPFDGVIINQPNDFSLSQNGQINEGTVSFSLGLKGLPDLAEELMIQRDISLLEYTDGRLHIANVSTAKGVNLIKKAKANGLKITASVAAINLLWDDTEIDGVDTYKKVLPPLRSKEDVLALRKALLDGVIDNICSNHVPREEETKKMEFPYAEFGAVGLETAFSASKTAFSGKTSLSWANWFSIRPRRILALPEVTIKEGEKANMTFYNPSSFWKVKAEDIFSKSKNSPFIGQHLQGKVVGILLGNNLNIRNGK